MAYPLESVRPERLSFASINEVLAMPNLIEIQQNSYKWFFA